MHTSWGAYEVNVIATLSSFFFMLIWFEAWRRTRHGYMLLLALGWFGLCFYWGMLAISAGSNPVIRRIDTLMPIRTILLVSMMFLVMGKLTILRAAYRSRAEMSEQR